MLWSRASPGSSLLLLAPGPFLWLQGVLCILRAFSWPLSVECPEAHAVLLSLRGPLFLWLKVNVREAFISWIH